MVWLLAAMTCWGAVFFLAVHLQVGVGLRPLTAGLLLTPIFLVMLAGSPVAVAAAGRFWRRRVAVAGLGVYASGLWLLSTVDAATAVPWGLLAPLAVFAVGMATFTAPVAAAGMGALDDQDQGVASGANNITGQLASLLAIIVLPALAGLGRHHVRRTRVLRGLPAGAPRRGRPGRARRPRGAADAARRQDSVRTGSDGQRGEGMVAGPA